jgi:hypothetical protein
MEKKIEILTRYGEADMKKRLYLFLQFPDLRWAFQEIELKDLAAQRALVSPAQQHHKGRCSVLLSLLGDIFDIKVFKIIWKSLSPSQTQADYLLNRGGTPWRKERSG